MIPKLKKKLGALKFSCKNASYKAKLKLAYRCIMSNITYGIQVWGLHCRPSILRKVQSIQTNTMKCITSNYNDSIKELLTTTKWLSVYQLSVYHSLILYWKVKFNGKPERIIRRLNKRGADLYGPAPSLAYCIHLVYWH